MTTDPKTPQAWGIQLAKLWGPHFPVKADRVALDYSAQRFRDEPITKVAGHNVDGFEGMLIERRALGRWYILYDERVTLPGRRNFTIGHELGHYLLHRAPGREFRCNQRAVLEYGSDESRRREQEANIFASYLLMPIDDFQREIRSNAMSFDLLEHCANRYEASLTAAALKWLEFTEEIALLVIGRDGFVLWSRPSSGARRRGYYLPPGALLPEKSRAACATHFNSDDRSGVVMPAGVWHTADETREMLIVSDQYEFTISLILGIGASARVEHEEPEPEDAFDQVMRPFNRADDPRGFSR